MKILIIVCLLFVSCIPPVDFINDNNAPKYYQNNELGHILGHGDQVRKSNKQEIPNKPVEQIITNSADHDLIIYYQDGTKINVDAGKYNLRLSKY